MAIALQTLETLEFPKVRQHLARYTAFSVSREMALSLTPSVDPVEVRQRLRLTDEARRLIDEMPDLTIGGARDVRPAAGLARRGGVCDAATLLDIAATLASARRLRTTLLKLDPEAFPLLREIAADLPLLPEIEDAIARAIGDDGQVLDSASAKLARLRAEVRTAFNRLQEKLHNLIMSYGDALQEPIITVRNGRYVIPVKATHRRAIRGLVHDQSASGATLYIEPLTVVDLNNAWRELQLAEQAEVERILAELSAQVGDHADAIITGVETLATLDLAFAMARYAAAMRCVMPEIADAPLPPDEPLFLLTAARHPLIDPQKVVPIDMRLGGPFRILLITGPNTGGKTVALKTTGLLALMAQAGMHIPASQPSRLPVFKHIFADIGDEQSIEQSLSTFSSHMTNIIRILRALEGGEYAETFTTDPTLREADRPSNGRTLDADALPEPERADRLPALVLLDELGAGTDPVEGSALARAIIERLLELGVLGVATTHYAELKAFAYATPGVENASVEFDVDTLAPTYKLTIGLPGRSNALAIAARLGLSPALIERARAGMARQDVQVEDLLAGIHRERDAAAAELQRAAEVRADAEKYRERLAAELREFEARRDEAWQAAREEIEAELRQARSEVRRLRDEFRSVSVSRQWLEEAERRLQEARARLPETPPGKSAERAAAVVEQGPRPLRPGDVVRVRSVGLTGEILSIDEEEQTADVQVGGFRMHVDLDELTREKRGNGQEGQPSRPMYESRETSIPAPRDVSLELDMRGWRAADVRDRLDRYLNDAYLAGLPWVRIIHGKGTGALRQAVRDLLKDHKLVASFSSASATEGGEGVTIVRLQER
ncbi:MAG: endonuclease MutS2 [Roseiflexaceae bacterium]|nr:endonuclease MutS2 [Roseiflexus sp.]MDW8214496.1 endonuclease MutS2 [Roseiflexaceae bacterium]